MPTPLTATPAASISLSATGIQTFEGLFPAFDPGSDEYPGRGSTLAATPATSTTLTGAPA